MKGNIMPSLLDKAKAARQQDLDAYQEAENRRKTELAEREAYLQTYIDAIDNLLSEFKDAPNGPKAYYIKHEPDKWSFYTKDNQHKPFFSFLLYYTGEVVHIKSNDTYAKVNIIETVDRKDTTKLPKILALLEPLLVTVLKDHV